ncbi:MAG: class I SAM-dependent methyltransferase [Thermoplasmatota archaeon]
MMDPAKAWESHYRRNPVSWKGPSARLPEIPSGSRVLDVGCGDGGTLIKLCESGMDAVGIDLSRTALGRTRERLNNRGFTAELFEMDILSDISFLGSFDAVFLHHVLDSLLESDRRKAVLDLTDEECLDLKMLKVWSKPVS